MLLSEAIILGSLLRPKVEGVRHNAQGTCALGAAEDAIGPQAYWRAHDFFPLLIERAIHPEYKVEMDITSIVCSLNNGSWRGVKRFAPWSREAVADWVAGEERKRGLPNEVAAPEEEGVCVKSLSS
jgi:hypothetical protein